MALFQTEQVVESRTNEQGLTEGELYVVTEVVEAQFGVVYYGLRPVDKKEALPNLVVNGHFLLDEVSS